MAMQIDDLGFRANVFANLCLAAKRENAAFPCRERLHGRLRHFHGYNLSVAQNEVRLLAGACKNTTKIHETK
jgi:hypothetical protein